MNMISRTCCIFAGGPETELPCLPVPTEENMLILCADSGLRLCERMGCKPDMVLGDFDSLHAVPTDYPHIVSPVKKDDTDTMFAARYALAHGCTKVLIYGAFGGRFDHTFANIQTLRFLSEQGAQDSMLIGASDYACICTASDAPYIFRKREGFTFSIFALSDRVSGVTLSGTEYPLQNADLTGSFPIGVSNRILAAEAAVSVHSGTLLVICSKE